MTPEEKEKGGITQFSRFVSKHEHEPALVITLLSSKSQEVDENEICHF